MLVLTRKRAETIRIGENIVIKVIRCGRSSVKIGIEAPANVRVVRGELTLHPVKSLEEDPHWSPVEEAEREMAHACSDQYPHPHVG